MGKMKIMRTILILGVVVLFASCTKVINQEMMVVKDCTGSYLRLNEKDYHICNIDIVDDIEDGSVVRASFIKIDNCSESDEVICMMYHANEGWIEVTNIK